MSRMPLRGLEWLGGESINIENHENRFADMESGRTEDGKGLSDNTDNSRQRFLETTWTTRDNSFKVPKIAEEEREEEVYKNISSAAARTLLVKRGE